MAKNNFGMQNNDSDNKKDVQVNNSNGINKVRFGVVFAGVVLVNLISLGGAILITGEIKFDVVAVMSAISYLIVGFLIGYWLGYKPYKELGFIVFFNIYTNFRGVVRGDTDPVILLFVIVGAAISYALAYYSSLYGVRLKVKKES